jgi:thiamine biosynthesis lipoprotein
MKILACCILAVTLTIGCDAGNETIFKDTRPAMYTIVSITTVSDSADKAQRAADDAFAELDRIAGLLNFYSDDSELSAINRMAGKTPLKVSAETLDIIERSVSISEATDGAFDVTVGPLVKLWDIQKKVVPDKVTIDRTRAKVGYKNILIDRSASTVFIKNMGGQIDLGGIIKGYGADRVVGILKQMGIRSAIVSVGGEVRSYGKKPDGKPWVVGIQNPRGKGPEDAIAATIEISDKALSTSGDYNKYFEKNGRRYHHLIDPKTGYPSLNCGSITVIADDATTSDGFSKLFIPGPEKGLKVAKKSGIEVIFIDCNGRVVLSDGVRDKVKFIER